MAELILGHWNVGGRRPDDVVKRIDALFSRYDLAALNVNEVGDQGVALHRLDVGSDLNLAVTPHTGKGGVKEGTIYRPDVLRMIHSDAIVVQRAGPGDPRAAGNKHGSPRIPAHYLAFAEFEHLPSGRTPIIATTHPAPSVHLLKQRALVHEHMTGTGRWAHGTHGLLLLTLDANVDAENDKYHLLNPLHDGGLTLLRGTGPTMGKRTIDQVWHRGGDLSPVANVREKWDHNAIVVRATFPDAKAA